MNANSIHRILGLVLILPLTGWILTGAVFLTKPGYQEAYEKLRLKTYPLHQSHLKPATNWQEARQLNSLLGEHLLVRIDDQWQHLYATDKTVWPQPDAADLKRLLQDAIAEKPQRYGEIVDHKNGVFITNTGVELSIDWDTLAVTQKGRDTKLIKLLYRIHYLQWFGQKDVNKLFGLIGLFTLFLAALYGAISYFSRKRN